MGTAPKMYFYLLLIVFICDGFNVHGPPGPLIVQLGDSVMLPCFVETPLPLEELEVGWKRNDSETLVHLWQDGESRPESQNQHYHERAHFFTEEIAHGNFSLLLTDVTSKDAGVYKCVVYTKLDSGETLIEIKEIERLIVSGAHIISAYAGEDITLNCSVDSHVTPEEVSWTKTDEGILVMLYEEGEIRTDSTGERYVDRVEFFSAEERNKGNFSLRLKNVRTEDKGLYMCLVFSGALSANTTVEIQQLGLSFLHIAIFILCILGFVIGSLILGFLSYTSYKKEEDSSRRALAIQCAHVLIPNITMSIVFILWGFTDGYFTEAATCSALNFARILFLLWIALDLKTFPDFPKRLITNLAILLQCTVITVAAYSSIIVDMDYRLTTAVKVALIIVLLVLLIPLLGLIVVVCCKRTTDSRAGWIYMITVIIDILRIIIFAAVMQRSLIGVLMWILVPIFIVTLFYSFVFCLSFFHYALLWLLLEFVRASGSIYVHYNLDIDVKERDALVCVTTFLQILSLITLFTFLNNSKATQRAYLVVFMFGTVGVVFVNAVVLSVELILKARNGERTVDLRLILLPTESVFAACYLALQISTFWKDNRERFKKDIEKLRQKCVCKQRQRDSPPQSNEHELASLASAPQT
ncbi:uncharacterized protein LOC113638948 [Tachysurus fulvidraco]|uniref:uncharacterized protein LOC113638948 n=1 Tax=Tachysurus fulvidraco TaxID=1234273 RepID=UPI001FEDDDA4|nr:uncharacterized protein LOC113638948 [Tachysurus fulvidraco]XP_047672911.1 uncharacterized protein LOC113638948 [Tachysurus fulvidraco]XP_047672913.1 uncharacterized protein LOC113638948 [Tachysurus fulvidraco]